MWFPYLHSDMVLAFHHQILLQTYPGPKAGFTSGSKYYEHSARSYEIAEHNMKPWAFLKTKLTHVLLLHPETMPLSLKLLHREGWKGEGLNATSRLFVKNSLAAPFALMSFVAFHLLFSASERCTTRSQAIVAKPHRDRFVFPQFFNHICTFSYTQPQSNFFFNFYSTFIVFIKNLQTLNNVYTPSSSYCRLIIFSFFSWLGKLGATRGMWCPLNVWKGSSP